MKHQRAALPTRTDLTSRPKRVAAKAAVHAEDLYERLKSWVLVEVTHPKDDPFYSAPDQLEAFRPGDVLASRPVQVRGARYVIGADAWHVKFRSSDVEGAPSWGVATVMIPRRRFNGPVRPLLSYQCAIDALGATADPSYTLRRGDQLELPFIALALRRGWAVVTTDFNGPQHAFGAYPLVSRFVLDGIRAAISFEPAGFDAATPIGLWGYSGGALATLFAIERQAAYAPELKLVGAAGGGADVDITSSPQMFEDGNLLNGIPFCAVIGISRGFPDVDLHSVLARPWRRIPTAPGHVCGREPGSPRTRRTRRCAPQTHPAEQVACGTPQGGEIPQDRRAGPARIGIPKAAAHC